MCSRMALIWPVWRWAVLPWRPVIMGPMVPIITVAWSGWNMVAIWQIWQTQMALRWPMEVPPMASMAMQMVRLAMVPLSQALRRWALQMPQVALPRPAVRKPKRRNHQRRRSHVPNPAKYVRRKRWMARRSIAAPNARWPIRIAVWSSSMSSRMPWSDASSAIFVMRRLSARIIWPGTSYHTYQTGRMCAMWVTECSGVRNYAGTNLVIVSLLL